MGLQRPGAHRAQPFTALMVRPRTIRRCNRNTPVITGTSANMPTRAIPPRRTPWVVIRLSQPTTACRCRRRSSPAPPGPARRLPPARSSEPDLLGGAGQGVIDLVEARHLRLAFGQVERRRRRCRHSRQVPHVSAWGENPSQSHAAGCSGSRLPLAASNRTQRAGSIRTQTRSPGATGMAGGAPRPLRRMAHSRPPANRGVTMAYSPTVPPRPPSPATRLSRPDDVLGA